MRKDFLFYASLSLLLLSSCGENTQEDYTWVKNGLDVATHQLRLTTKELPDATEMPRSIWVGYDTEFLCKQLGKDITVFKDSLRRIPESFLGQRRLCDVYDWTSGFFPGTLWYIYELTGDDYFRQEAIRFTNLMNPVRSYTGTHDLGFMMYCSYGNALRLAPSDTIPAVLVETSDNLAGRFDEKIGAIRSWDFGTWNFPVIIDNMMNLDLLFFASRHTGDPRYKEIAVRHADKTLKHHFRPDASSYHVISYHPDGTVERRQTHQGKNDESSWARGQAWAIYGYISCYRETCNKIYLDFAERIGNLIMSRVKTADLIPLWDYDAPDTPDTPRDASAAAITACAMLDMSTMVSEGQKYFAYGEALLKNLSGERYLAKKGENQGFILMHSTGSLPHGSEIDTPLNYADYYYLEGLKKYMELVGLR